MCEQDIGTSFREASFVACQDRGPGRHHPAAGTRALETSICPFPFSFLRSFRPIFSFTEILKYRQLTLVHRRKSMANLDPSYALKTFASLLIH